MWSIITVGLLVSAVIVYEVRKHIASTLQQEGWTPVTPGPAVPTGITKTSTGTSVMLAPGDMGSVNVGSASAFPPPTVQVSVQPPSATSSGVGWISGITSSNPSVVSPTGALINPGQPGQMSAPLTAMGAGTANITVQWNDGQTSRTTTFSIVATA